MINLRPWQRMHVQKALKLLPIHRAPLTTAVQPFPENPCRPMQEPPHMGEIERHAIVADVSPEFGTKRGPQGAEAFLVLPGTRPFLDPLELRTKPFPTGFHLGNDRPFP